MAVYLAPLASGLGDAIVTLPLIYKSIEQQKTYLVARSPRQEGLFQAIEGLAGVVREPDLNTKVILGPDDQYLNLRLHPIQRDYVWGGEKFAKDYPNFGISEVLEVIARDYGIPIDTKQRKKLLFTHMPEFADKTIILPGTTVKSKVWPTSNWQQLIALLEAQNHKVVMIGEPEHSSIVKELIDAGVEWQPTEALQSAINIISSSKAVVSVDTGLMHVSVQQDIPTIVMFQGASMYLRPFPNCFPLFGKECPASCIQHIEDEAPNEKLDFLDYQWCHVPYENCFADLGQSCMESMTPQAVCKKVQQALKGRK